MWRVVVIEILTHDIPNFFAIPPQLSVSAGTEIMHMHCSKRQLYVLLKRVGAEIAATDRTFLDQLA